VVQVAVAGVGVALLSFADGGYFARTWPPATVAFVAAGALVVLWARDLGSLGTAWTVVAGLAAYAAWQALSAWWSLDSTSSLRDAERGLVYVAAAAALAAAACGGRWLLVGVLAGATGVAAYSLVDRAVSGAPVVDPTQGTLLVGPLGYANALGILSGLAVVIAVGFAATTRSVRERYAVLACGAVALVALALTSSRGAWAATVVGILTTAFFAHARRLRAAWLALVALLVAAVLASPLAVNPSTLERYLSDRPYYWWTAWHALGDRPLLGSGAGTFDLIWAAGAPIPVFVRDAHSLYLETLVELGPLGLLLVLAALAVPLVAAVRAHTDVAAVATGAYVAFLVHAGVDWDWEMPAVTVAGLACGIAVLAERKFRPGAASDKETDPTVDRGVR